MPMHTSTLEVRPPISADIGYNVNFVFVEKVV